MQFQIADLVGSTTATSGTGTLTLGGAIGTLYRSFATAVSDGDLADAGLPVPYTLCVGSLTAPTAVEVGYGALGSSGTTLTRGTVLYSTNSGSAVDIPSATTSYVVLGVPAAWYTPDLLTPSQITGDQNDYAPSGWQQADVVRLDTDASRTITGFAAPSTARAASKILFNVGSNDLVIAHQSGSSNAANRVITTTGADVTLAAGEAALLTYDPTSDRWRLYAFGGGGGGITIGSAVATTSGTSQSLTGFSADAKLIRLFLKNVSTNGTSAPIVQAEVGGTPQASGYAQKSGFFQNVSGAMRDSVTAGIDLFGTTWAATYSIDSMIIQLIKYDASSNEWFFNITGYSDGFSPTAYHRAHGSFSLSGDLSGLRITTVGGTDQLDAGEIKASEQT